MVKTAEAKQPAPLPPCRLYVILAREAPIGVIFRRGPAKRVQLLHWNTDTDTFTPGQWLHGRIYEKRSDLSPNGKLLVYAARKEQAYTRRDEPYRPAWTAISKPPYVTALALWLDSISFGGGLFFSDTKVWLNHDGHPEPHPGHVPQGIYAYNSASDVSEEVLLNRRLERDGWRHIQELQGEQAPSIHEKPYPDHNVTLVMTTARSGYKTQYRYSVRQSDGQIFYLNDAEWADWDKRGRLVFAQDGRIFAQDAAAIGQEPPTELINLNGNTPEPMVAPEWAKVW